MKNKIRLDKLQTGLKSSLLTREKRHRISLGNGLTVYFTNINEAKSYLNATNRFLNNLIHNVSSIYIQLWSEYRKLYLHKYQVLGNNMKIKSSISIIEKSIDLLITRSHWTNGNSFTFKWFDAIFDEIETMNNLIIKMLKESKSNDQVNSFNTIHDFLEYQRYRLNNWGSELQHNTPRCFYDFKTTETLSPTDDSKSGLTKKNTGKKNKLEPGMLRKLTVKKQLPEGYPEAAAMKNTVISKR